MAKSNYELASGGFVRFSTDEVQAISTVKPGGMGTAWFNLTLINGRTYQLSARDHRRLMQDAFGGTKPHCG